MFTTRHGTVATALVEASEESEETRGKEGGVVDVEWVGVPLRDLPV